MYDDGQHNDENLNDYIFGTSFYSPVKEYENMLEIGSIKVNISNDGKISDVLSTLKIPFQIYTVDNHNLQFTRSDTIIFSSVGSTFDGKSLIFSGGFGLSGFNNDSLWANAVMTTFLIDDYVPGNVGSNPSDARNRIYRVRRSDPHFGKSWQEWKDAVSQGAYFYDGNKDGNYNPIDLNKNGLWDSDEDMPDIMGDVTYWCVYNDGLRSVDRKFTTMNPLGIEIRQTIFASEKNSYLRNTFFIRYSIVNKGTVNPSLKDVIFTVFVDPDIGDYIDDLVGSDTLLQSNFTYNDSSDLEFGVNPPSLFMTLLQGPPIYTGNLSDTAFNKKGKILGEEIYPGYINLKSSSIFSFLYDLLNYPISNVTDFRNYALGKLKNGNLVNPCTHFFGRVLGGIDCNEINPLFSYSGDPVTNVGWINTFPYDVRSFLNVGPSDLTENKPVDIIVAYTAWRGSAHLNSLQLTRSMVKQVIQEYISNFSTITAVDDNVFIPRQFQLYQNYPNPFNNVTKIKFALPFRTNVKLVVYNSLGQKVKEVLNEDLDAGIYERQIDFRGFASGVYYYQLKANFFIDTKKMILLK